MHLSGTLPLRFIFTTYHIEVDSNLTSVAFSLFTLRSEREGMVNIEATRLHHTAARLDSSTRKPRSVNL